MNYPQNELPASFYLNCDEIDGFYDEGSNSTHVVASSSLHGGISSIVNTGGFMGFNATYEKTSEPIAWDLSTIQNLTFNVTVPGSAVQYPT